MVITTKDITNNDFLDEDKFIDDMIHLSNSESDYQPIMVPVRESSYLNKNIIRLEDLLEYSRSNSITDAGESITNVCEHAGIDIDSICFTLNEENLIGNEEMADTVKCFLSEGVDVLLNPIPEDDLAFRIGDMCYESFLATGDPFYLEAYADPLSEVTVAVGRAFGKDGAKYDYYYDTEKKQWIEQKTAFYKKLMTLEDELEAENPPKSWLAKKIKWLRDVYKKWMLKSAKMTAEGKAGIFRTIAAIILRLIDTCLKKLQKWVD